MTLNVDLTPETEAGLTALAQAQGLTLEAYVGKILRERGALTISATTGNSEKARAFVAWAQGHGPVGSLSDDSIGRETLIRDPR